MSDRAFLIRQAVRNGITDINSIRDLYNESGERVRLGPPYKTFEVGSDYDYYNAAPENKPENNDGHWSSRNPHTGQILKHKDHPTSHKTVQGEKDAGYEIITIEDRAYSFVGDKADSLQWKKEYRERYGHQFSGKENNKIQTDTEHKTDNSLIERIALNIGSKEAAKDAGHASIRDIVTGTIDALMGKRPTNNNNLAAFLGKPEDYGFEELTDNRGPQFNDIISQYENQNIKTYKGVINPFNEYVVSQEDYDKFLELAKTGDTFYGNADWDNVKYFYDIIDSRNTTTTSAPLHEGYRDDVKNYPIQFYTKNGKLFANAADFYDFNTDSFQGKILTKKGNPYILRQNDIPVRAIYVPEEFKDLNILPYDAEGLTDDVRRAINMRETVRIRENQEKSNKNKK